MSARTSVLRAALTLTVAAGWLRVRRAEEWRRRVAFCRDLNLELAQETA